MRSRVEILYVDGCPHYAETAQHVRALLEQEGAVAEVELRCVDDEEDAQAARFLGSPSVRVDGRDVEPGADRREDFGMKCRLYSTAEGLRPVPPEAWIADALRE